MQDSKYQRGTVRLRFSSNVLFSHSYQSAGHVDNECASSGIRVNLH